MPRRFATYMAVVTFCGGSGTARSGSTNECTSSSGLMKVKRIVSPSTTVMVLGEKAYTSLPSSTPPLAKSCFRNGKSAACSFTRRGTVVMVTARVRGVYAARADGAARVPHAAAPAMRMSSRKGRTRYRTATRPDSRPLSKRLTMILPNLMFAVPRSTHRSGIWPRAGHFASPSSIRIRAAATSDTMRNVEMSARIRDRRRGNFVERPADCLARERLLDENDAARQGATGAHRLLGVARHQNHRQVGPLGVEDRREIQSALSGHHRVGQYHVERRSVGPQNLERRRDVRRGNHIMAESLEHEPSGLAYRGIVF